eukprot:jgi/Astpho2/5719/fgenesh1_pm.00079_%23_56_t
MGRLTAQIPNEDPARLQRIQDAKWRTIGVRHASCTAQSRAGISRPTKQLRRCRDYAARAQHYDDVICAQQQAADRAKHAWDAQVQNYRQQYQGAHTTTEWDLNRPDRLALDQPARLGDDDPRCGPASLQRFEGEDLSIADRTRAQQEQSSEWWQMQQEQHARRKAMDKARADRERELVLYQDEVQRAAAAQERAIRSANNRAVLEANAQLAAARRGRDAAIAANEQARSDAELAATVMDPYLVEDPAMAASATSPFRVRKDHWKGMSETEKRAIADMQLQQMAEKQSRKQQELQEEAEYADLQARIGRSILQQAYQVEEFKAQMARQAADFLKRQMSEKEARDASIKALYANSARPEYFKQFGTSHR